MIIADRSIGVDSIEDFYTFQSVLRFIVCVYREAIQEDEKGSLQASVDDIISKAKRRKLLEKISNVRLGMVCR